MQGSEAGADRRWWVLTTVGVGTFMSALDSSVVNTILPVLTRELGASVAAIEWVPAIYLLVISALLLGVGRAGDLFGYKRLYLAGFGLFVIGSMLCGLSPNVEALIGFRVLQGIGASMLYASSPAILTASFPPNQRGRALGAQGTFTYLGLSIGPSLGGYLASAVGWRSVFYMNVPVGLLAIFLALRVVANDRPAARGERFDVAGATLFGIALAAVIVALNKGHDWGWGSGPVLAFLVASAAIFAAFVALERRRAHPMLDPALFRSRAFSAAAASALLNYVCLYALLFVLPFLLIHGRGLDARHAGLVLTAQPIVMAIVAPFSGALSDRVGSRLPSTLGMAIIGVGLAVLGAIVGGASLAAIAGCLAFIGLGIGIFVSPNNSALMGAAPRNRQGIAAGVLATARNAGMVLGVGLAGAVFTTVLAGAPEGSLPALVAGTQASLWVAAAVAVVGAVTSGLR
jgi:EmrB/QacA subfamily drug resistance transporter